MITPEIRELIVQTLHSKYGAWTGFRTPAFLADEVDYKQKIIANVKPLLAADRLQDLVVRSKFDDIIKLLENAAQKSTNLLYLSTPKSGDLRILHAKNLDPQAFCHAMLDLMYGEGAPSERLGRYVSGIQAVGLPSYWTFPTYYLFATDPAHSIFVKPRTMHAFFKFIQAGDQWPTEPSAEGYARIINVAQELGTALREYEPNDMVDIQSVMYICADAYNGKLIPIQSSPASTEPVLGFPFSRIFRSYDEANAAFDLLNLAFEYLGVTGEADEAYALTIPRGGKDRVLRLNFGNWATLAFYGSDVEANCRVEINLKEGVSGLKLSSGTFSQRSDEPRIRFYEIPMSEMSRLTGSYAAEFEDSFRYIGQRFANRNRCLYRDDNIEGIGRAVLHPEERLALLTRGLSPSPELAVNTKCPFSEKTFSLLEGIQQEPRLAYYQAHQADFKTYVEEPFQRVMGEVAQKLPVEILAIMETERRIFARFTKNDFGQGGAWSHYWGAFYPKGSKRSQDAQLSIWLNYQLFEYGFYIGDYGSTQRQRFMRNCANLRRPVEKIMEELFEDVSVMFGDRDDFVITERGTVVYKSGNSLSWSDFLENPERYYYDVSLIVPKSVLLQQDQASLTARILDGHKRLYPLVLLALSDDPLPAIEQYLIRHFPASIETDVPEINPVYTVDEVSVATGVSPQMIATWVRAVQRKGQAIFYGPPGTGKTYVAGHLAKHLVGGGDGFVDLVQFHPAYAYEDFVQGIRPRSSVDGKLDYPVVPGRFLEFCREAAGRSGPCVLIIDEINRANLARVFGELMYLLEYRNNDIPLAAGGQRFRIPKNALLIGTMNTADRSIALVDHALRRRFAFLELQPDYNVLRQYLTVNCPNFPINQLVTLLQRLNRQIADRHYEVGISFFLIQGLDVQLEDIWRMEIQPYLDEYFFDQTPVSESFQWEKIRAELGL